MKKLKRKRITCTKNADRSNGRSIEKKFPVSDNQLKMLGFVASVCSILRSAKELGWFQNLSVLWEKFSTAFTFIYDVFFSFMK